MSAEQTPAIAAVLAEHTGSECGDLGSWCIKCYCGHDTTVTRFPGDAWDAHRAHVAAALTPVLAAAVREAEERAWDEGYEARKGEDQRSPGECNPYREPALCHEFVYTVMADGRAPLRDRADRITEPVSHEVATSGEEASKA